MASDSLWRRALAAKWLRIALVAATTATGGTGVAAVWLREPPSAVTVGDAVADFNAARSAGEPRARRGAAPAEPTTTAGPHAGEASTAGDEGGDVAGASSARAGAAAPSAPATVAAGAAPPSASPASRLPAEGVYTFRTEGGGETDALGGARHEYPPEVPLTVRHTACGYTVTWQPLKERWDEWEFCASPGHRAMTRISTYHEFFQRPLRQDFDCGGVEAIPPNEPGRTMGWSCNSKDSTIEVTSTYVGTEMLDVGGVPTKALRVRHDGVFRGANEGSQSFEWWVHYDTGLPLHMTRTLQTKSNTPFGRVNYKEAFTSTAASLTPQTGG